MNDLTKKKKKTNEKVSSKALSDFSLVTTYASWKNSSVLYDHVLISDIFLEPCLTPIGKG